MSVAPGTSKGTTYAVVGKPFIPGTLGWAAADLRDPRIGAAWEAGAYEIVEGVLTIRPAAYVPSGRSLLNLLFILRAHQKATGLAGGFSTEVDVVLVPARVARVDALYLTPEDERRHAEAARAGGSTDPDRERLLVPPTLVIESLSPGHERHDEVTKRRWYGEARVPHYWLVNAYRRTLECLILDTGAYRVDATGADDAELRPTLFPGCVIPLRELWAR